MKKVIVWALQIITAVILLQTLYFKFSAHPDSVQLFTEIGMEPSGRIIIGVCELIAGILLVIPGSAAYGAFLAAGVMVGAVIGHITVLGFEGPRLSLGLLGVAVLIMSITILILRRSEIPIIGKMLEKPEAAQESDES